MVKRKQLFASLLAATLLVLLATQRTHATETHPCRITCDNGNSFNGPVRSYDDCLAIYRAICY